MTTLSWQNVLKTIQTGIDRGVLYPKEPIVNDSSPYPLGVPWVGLISVAETASGAEVTDLYADNVKYMGLLSRETLSGTIEAYTAPDEFDACDGSLALLGGVMAKQQPRKGFGLSYRTNVATEANPIAKHLIHLVYGITASPSERNHSTINETPEALTLSWEFSTTPVAVTNMMETATIVIDTSKLNAAQLSAVNDALYGTASTDAYLPLPDELKIMLDALATP